MFASQFTLKPRWRVLSTIHRSSSVFTGGKRNGGRGDEKHHDAKARFKRDLSERGGASVLLRCVRRLIKIPFPNRRTLAETISCGLVCGYV